MQIKHVSGPLIGIKTVQKFRLSKFVHHSMHKVDDSKPAVMDTSSGYMYGSGTESSCSLFGRSEWCFNVSSCVGMVYECI